MQLSVAMVECLWCQRDLAAIVVCQYWLCVPLPIWQRDWGCAVIHEQTLTCAKLAEADFIRLIERFTASHFCLTSGLTGLLFYKAVFNRSN